MTTSTTPLTTVLLEPTASTSGPTSVTLGLTMLTVGLAVFAVLLWPTRRRGAGRAHDPEPQRAGRTGWRARRRAKDVMAVEDPLADLLGLVAAPLRAGVPATTSLAAGAAAVQDSSLLAPLVEELVAAGAAGEPVSETWLRHAAQLDSGALRFVGRAWSLSERTGAPLADALQTSEEVLRARLRSRERLASAAAGPRASMAVLALLPLSGPVVGLACGIGPRQLYLGTTWSTASLVVGVVLAAFGWWWSRAILDRAA